ncbi:MAG: HAD-IIIA family hydrolase [Alphaproteobacteria bacterium]|jgi:D-glycero-D-manno-heptose 1,7-bisphosphate phosphatase|nr:HAD-IIIA family hydrolase [Alphaproteobacteria bacterium]MBT5390218.1 HAD-IIIA family hydrolase [Alphaproteobacteria bacterium]MBT5541110.1 HAD-IIIA family hydrolase [Alphaproteobacteria bacterium]MBT5654277.1 HAD-IIIA family hydrolase [Alphaproteobacteria bacterium]
MTATKLVLLDRDGVINEDRQDYVKSVEEFVILPGVIEAIQLWKQAGWKIALVTNQSAIGQNIISEEDLQAIHDHLQTVLRKNNAKIDKIYVCPDHPQFPTNRRKPNPGMIHEALADFNVEAAETPFIGDTIRDLEAAFSAGCPRHLVRTGHGRAIEKEGLPLSILPVSIHDDLLSATKSILTP